MSAWQVVGCKSALVPVGVACMRASEGRVCTAGALAGKQALWA